MSEIKTVSVIGMGYIGLPTCAIFASRGLDVIGIDVNQAVVEKVNRGEIHIVEPDLDGLIQKVVANGKLKAFSTPQPADAYVIAVPTPITERPQARYQLCARCRRAASRPVLQARRPCRAGIDLAGRHHPQDDHAAGRTAPRPQISRMSMAKTPTCSSPIRPSACCPARCLTELINNDRSIGGLSRKSSERTAALYASFVAGDLFITSAESAELVKLTENAFRDVNIAFANELAAVCQDLSLNVWEVIDLANRHPRVNILQPGPGVGGHCIAVDPYFIIDAAPNSTRLMSSARRINSDRPYAVVKDIEALLDPTRQQTVACLGLSFKPNIDDLRESPAVEVVGLLAELPNVKIIAAEPQYARACRMNSKARASSSPTRCRPSTRPISSCCWSITASST